MKLNQQLNLNQPNLKDVLLAALKNKLSSSDYLALMLYERWESICGKDISKKTKPKALYKNVLTVSVDNPVLIFELGFIKEEFIKKINDFFSSENNNLHLDKSISVKDIRFTNK
jgi:predicted nucleic acid-binding Zn ribbon protein